MIKEEKFTAVVNLSLENSFGTLKQQDDVEINIHLAIKDEEYGFFEFYAEDTEEWYAEGMLEIVGNNIVGYDGVFALPEPIINKLKEWGYNTEEIE